MACFIAFYTLFIYLISNKQKDSSCIPYWYGTVPAISKKEMSCPGMNAPYITWRLWHKPVFESGIQFAVACTVHRLTS